MDSVVDNDNAQGQVINRYSIQQRHLKSTRVVVVFVVRRCLCLIVLDRIEQKKLAAIFFKTSRSHTLDSNRFSLVIQVSGVGKEEDAYSYLHSKKTNQPTNQPDIHPSGVQNSYSSYLTFVIYSPCAPSFVIIHLIASVLALPSSFNHSFLLDNMLVCNKIRRLGLRPPLYSALLYSMQNEMERAKVEEDEDTLYSTEFYVELNLVGNQNSFRKNSANHPTIPPNEQTPFSTTGTYVRQAPLPLVSLSTPHPLSILLLLYHYSFSVFALWNLGACLFLSYIMMGLLLVCCCCCFIFFCCSSSCCSCMQLHYYHHHDHHQQSFVVGHHPEERFFQVLNFFVIIIFTTVHHFLLSLFILCI